MKQLINQPVDLVLTDPPYNISRKNNFTTMGRRGIDFGAWDKNFELKWVTNLYDITSKDASVIIFVGFRQITEYIGLMEENGFDFKDMIRWIKSNPMPRNVERRYVSDGEFALWFTKKKSKWTFNKPKDVSYLRPEIKSGLTPNNQRIHPTQKHLMVLEKLLLIHSNENDLVLDCFMGSGSCAIACLKLKRNFIGIEKDKDYFNKAKTWIDSTYQPLC